MNINGTVCYPEYAVRRLNTPTVPNFLEKVNSAQPTLSRLPTPQLTEDPTVTIIKNCIEWATKHPRETIAIGAGVAITGLFLMLLDSDNNN